MMTATMNGTRMYNGGTENADTLPHVGAVVVSCTGPSWHRFGVVTDETSDRRGKRVTVRWDSGDTSEVSCCVGHIESGHPESTRGIGVYTLSDAMIAKAAAIMVRRAHAEAAAAKTEADTASADEQARRFAADHD